MFSLGFFSLSVYFFNICRRLICFVFLFPPPFSSFFSYWLNPRPSLFLLLLPLFFPCLSSSSSSPSRLPLLPVAYVPVNVPPPAPTCPPSLIPALTLCCSQRLPVSQAAQGAPLPPPQRLHGLQTQNALPAEPEARGKCVCVRSCVCPPSFVHVSDCL